MGARRHRRHLRWVLALLVGIVTWDDSSDFGIEPRVAAREQRPRAAAPKDATLGPA